MPGRRLNYHERVARAVKDQTWQELRKGLKGTTTEHKLRILRKYLATQGRPEAPQGSQAYHDIATRVDNYLKALARGGQIEPEESGAYLTKLKLKKLRIKR